MRQKTARIVWLVAAVFLLGAAPPAAPPPESEEVAPPFAQVHSDLRALERAVVDTTLAFIRSDMHAARAALDRLNNGCRRISRDEASNKLLEDVMLYDQAFHKTVDLSREFATGGQIDRSFDQFVWAQKACRTCHGLAVKAGIMKETPAQPK